VGGGGSNLDISTETKRNGKREKGMDAERNSINVVFKTGLKRDCHVKKVSPTGVIIFNKWKTVIAGGWGRKLHTKRRGMETIISKGDCDTIMHMEKEKWVGASRDGKKGFLNQIQGEIKKQKKRSKSGKKKKIFDVGI